MGQFVLRSSFLHASLYTVLDVQYLWFVMQPPSRDDARFVTVPLLLRVLLAVHVYGHLHLIESDGRNIRLIAV